MFLCMLHTHLQDYDLPGSDEWNANAITFYPDQTHNDSYEVSSWNSATGLCECSQVKSILQMLHNTQHIECHKQ